MPQVYRQVTVSVLAIGLEAPQVSVLQYLRSKWQRTRAMNSVKNVHKRAMGAGIGHALDENDIQASLTSATPDPSSAAVAVTS